jgi:hypothetical protein
MLIDFWATEADFTAGKPAARHDCTFGFGGQKHPNPGPVVLRRLESKAAQLMADGTRVDPEIVAAWKEGADPEGNWQHPSMRQFDPVNE